MTAPSSDAAIWSAVAAAVSATFAGASTLAAWLTVRGRRPKLQVTAVVGDAADGGMKRNSMGEFIGIRAANVRDSDVEVIDMWFESRNPRVLLRWPPLTRQEVPMVWPRPDWFMGPPADAVPGSIKAHHTAAYTFRMSDLGQTLAQYGHGTYWTVVQVAGGRCFRSRSLDVAAVQTYERKREIP